MLCWCRYSAGVELEEGVDYQDSLNDASQSRKASVARAFK